MFSLRTLFHQTWSLLKRLLLAVDAALVAFARAFGVNFLNPWARYGLFAGLYAAIYAVALLPLPALSLMALTVGYVGVLAVGRAWVRNEKYRAAIVKKLVDDDPDKTPDLRGLALLSALQLLLLFPLIFAHVQSLFGLYDTPPDMPFWGWLAFTFDSFCKALLDWMEVYDINFTDIGYASPWGRHLVMLKRLTIDFILIQGVIRLFAVRTTIREGIGALAIDWDMPRRLGRRGVPPLIQALEDWRLCRAAATALGRIGDARCTAVNRGTDELG